MYVFVTNGCPVPQNYTEFLVRAFELCVSYCMSCVPNKMYPRCAVPLFVCAVKRWIRYMIMLRVRVYGGGRAMYILCRCPVVPTTTKSPNTMKPHPSHPKKKNPERKHRGARYAPLSSSNGNGLPAALLSPRTIRAVGSRSYLPHQPRQPHRRLGQC